MERSGQKVGLAQFIREERENILEEFEEFARTHTRSGDTMDIRALRDHAAGMLATIALDMEQYQSAAAQDRKAKGDVPDHGQAIQTAAESHGTDRAEDGFSLREMVAEYRALRASVLRLWTTRHGALDGDGEDVIRFNEAIDTAMTESIPTFTEKLDHSREMFLAILGHDLRTPLHAIVAASSFLTTDGALTGRSLTMAERIQSSGRRMSELVSDLVDVTRGHLGRGIPVSPVEIDLAEIGREAVDEIQLARPTNDLRFEVRGDVRGEWDPDRLSQALSNLIGNAVEHGGESTPIVVTARGEGDEVVVFIHNQGSLIGPENKERIFDAFERLRRPSEERRKRPRLRSSGLGLYIAKEIVLAHGGSIRVRSTVEEGTTFELHLPRRVSAASSATSGMPSA